MSTNLQFVRNGIEVNGQLHRAHYSYNREWTVKGQDGTEKTIPLHVKVWAKDLDAFPQEVREVFEVLNRTDSMTDYFENDHIRVLPSQPLWIDVVKAYVAQERHHIRMQEKRGKSPLPSYVAEINRIEESLTK